MWINVRRASFILLSAAILAMAQQRAPATSHPQSGTISGRVFLITKGGDIKPARMALVFGFFLYGLDVAKAGTETAGKIWRKKEENELEQAQHEIESSKPELTQEGICRREYFAYAKAEHERREWCKVPEHMNDLIGIQADEEGTFKLLVPRPGTYTIVVSGRAGMNKTLRLAVRWRCGPGYR